MFVDQWLALPEVAAMTSDAEHDASALYSDYLSRGGIEGRRAFANVLVANGFNRRKSCGRIYYSRRSGAARFKGTPLALSLADRETFASLGNGNMAHGLRLAAAMVRAGVLSHLATDSIESATDSFEWANPDR